MLKVPKLTLIIVDMMPGHMLDDDRGVSVIIGAMLLILITIVAAASLAVIVSQAEKQAADRQAKIDAVNNEKLKINGIHLTENQSRPGYVDYVNVTIQNMNTDPSRLVTVYLNDNPAKQYNVSGIYNGNEWISSVPYDINNRFDVNASGSVKLIINTSELLLLSTRNITLNNSLTVKVMTSLVNTFNVTFNPPSPIISTRIETGTFNGINRDYIVLDGSGSSGDRSIVQYNWTVFDDKIQRQYNLSGKVVQFYPDSPGPFAVRLTAINDVGLKGTTSNYSIASSSGFSSQDLSVSPVINSTMKDEMRYWGMDITITNRMPDAVNINNIILSNNTMGEISADNFTVKNASGVWIKQGMTVLDGSRSTVIMLNFSGNFSSPLNLSITDPITVKVMTNYSNSFNVTVKPPSAIAKITMQTQDLGSVKRDYISLDGSDSYSTNTMVGWHWSIMNDSSKIVEKTASGRVTQAFMDSPGPFSVTLNVTDSSGLVGRSTSMYLPANDNFNPTSLISWTQPYGNVVNVRVTNFNNQPMPGVYVNLVPQYGPFTLNLDSFSGITDSSGLFTFHILSGSGTISATTGSISKTIVLIQGASFTAIPSTGLSPLSVQFTDTTTNSPTSWQWDFDNDGTTDSTDQNPSHIYNMAGTYTVNLRINGGTGLSIAKYTIIVNGASFTANPTSGPNPLTVQFTDTSANGPTSWQWDFDNDGTTDSTDQNPAPYTYNMTGIYNATLTVTGTDGTSTAKCEINVA